MGMSGVSSALHVFSCSPVRSGEQEIPSISWFRGFSQLLMELVSGQAAASMDFLMSMGSAQFQNTKLAGLGSQVHSRGLLFPLRSGEHQVPSISWFRGFSSF